MSTRLRALARMLERTGEIHEFVAVERISSAAELHTLGARSQPSARRVHGVETDLAVYRDLRGGRGSARARIAGAEPVSRQRIEALADQAEHSLEPPWSLPPPAAPARVDVLDPRLPDDLMGAARALYQRIARLLTSTGPVADAAGTPLAASGLSVRACRDRVSVHTSHGFFHQHEESLTALRLSIAPRDLVPGTARTLMLDSRRLADLDLEAALARVARHLRDRPPARPAPPGRYDLVLRDDALTPRAVTSMTYASDRLLPHARAIEYGWLAPLAAQADARLARLGLTRVGPGRPIFERAGARRADETRSADASGDPFTLISDGAIPYGLRSAPVGDLGEPVRRFALIEHGVVAELALDQVEAGLRGVTANGGVRNLRLMPGAVPTEELLRPDTRPVLEVVNLDGLEIDPMSGACVADIGLAYLIHGETREPVTGGVVRGNVFELLARARLSAEIMVAGWYHGPRAIRCNNVELS